MDQPTVKPDTASTADGAVSAELDNSRRLLLASALRKLSLGLTSGLALSACGGKTERGDDGGQDSGGNDNGQESICGRRCRSRPSPTPAPTPAPAPAPGSTPAPAPAPAPAPTAGGRTFVYLGYNSASVSVNMGASQTLADGSALRVWSFGGGFNNDRPVPSPVIELIEGQTAAITLNSMMPHTLHPHGLDVNQANDGVPSTSGFVGMAMMMGNFGRVGGLPSLGTSFTYTFVAPHAGTYLYHCHVDTVLHLEMGMYGSIIVRPPDGATDRAWNGGPQFQREYLWHLHTYDSSWHGLTVSGAATVRYRPNVFMINGRQNDLAANDPTVAISGSGGDSVLLRLVNPGYLPADVSLGGLEFQVIASDGRPVRSTFSATRLRILPGERYDLLLTLPAGTNTLASIDYLDIRGATVLGSVNTVITAT